MQLVVGLVILVVVVVWLAVLTFYLFRLSSHYNSLTSGVGKKSLMLVLDGLLREVGVAKQDIAKLKVQCDKIEESGLFHIQKIGLLRFNPFKDTGGDQSFILALVNAKDTGVVISGLYSRSGTRWYAKKVIEGKGIDHELSEDEQKALKLAKEMT